MEGGRTEEREHRERDNDEQKLVLEVVRQNLSWTIRNLTLPSESFCGRGRGTPLEFRGGDAGLDHRSELTLASEKKQKSLGLSQCLARAHDVDCHVAVLNS